MLEYVVVVGVVITILFAMNTMIRRGLQGFIKVTADQIGTQQNAEQDFNSAYLVSSNVSTYSRTVKQQNDRYGVDGYGYNYPGDVTQTDSVSLTNLGISER